MIHKVSGRSRLRGQFWSCVNDANTFEWKMQKTKHPTVPLRVPRQAYLELLLSFPVVTTLLLCIVFNVSQPKVAWAESPNVFDMEKPHHAQSDAGAPVSGSVSAPELCEKGKEALEAFTTRREPDLLKEALQRFNQSIMADETYAPVYLGLATVMTEIAGSSALDKTKKQHLADQMQTLIDRAEKINPNLSELVQTKALVAHSIGNRKAAEQWARQSIAHHPELPLAYWVLAIVLKTDEQAVKALQDGLIVATKPVDVWLLNMELSRTYGTMERPELLLEACQRAEAAVPGTWWPLNNSAKALIELKRYEEAIPIARQALDLQDYVWTRAYLIEALLSLGRIEEMRREAASLQDAEALAYLCIKLGEHGRFEDALNLAERAIQIAPSAVGPHAQRGHAFHDLGRQPEAVAEYQMAVQLPPKNRSDRIDQSDCYFFMSYLANKEGRLRDAATLCQKALEVYPTHKAANRLLSAIRAHQNAR